jgi:beta-lactamase class C
MSQEQSLPPAVAERVREAMQSGQVPGIVLAVARGHEPTRYLVAGTDAGGAPLAADTLFLVASITKLATALAALRLVDAGALELDAPLSRFLPDAASAQQGVSLRSLLAHTSGLPTDIPPDEAPYAPDLSWDGLRRGCLATPLEAPPLTRVQYSNVGYGLAAMLVEGVTGKPFAQALQQLVLGPLRIEGYLGATPPRPVAAVANVRGRHAGTELEPFNSDFYRGLGMPWAGLITTADGALALARAFAGEPPGFLRPRTREAAISDQSSGLSGGFAPPLMWDPCPWGLGPDLRGAKTPHWAPAEAGPDSFGHSGASGCLAWASPSANVAWALIGARTADSGWLLRRSPAIGAALLE